MTEFYCLKCGTKMKVEGDTGIVYCPIDQIAFMYELLDQLLKMAVDYRDSLDERVYGPSGS